jgi:L-rhamnose-H+ transport protein
MTRDWYRVNFLARSSPMITFGILLALASGACNGVFTTPMKLIPRWKWENIWFVFIVTSCVAMPLAIVSVTVPDWPRLLSASPPGAVRAAGAFGFAWGFGAILFGLSVDRLGVSVANTLVLAVSSALGSLVPLMLHGELAFELRQIVLFLGVGTFLLGLGLCGSAGRLRDRQATLAATAPTTVTVTTLAGYGFAVGAGVMSAIFNIGFSLALPITATIESFGYQQFLATNCIWLLMLGAGSIPNMVFCAYLMKKHTSGRLFLGPRPDKTWGGSILMGLLWGGSIFLYGAAAPMLGDIGPSIGWPLSLATALLVANTAGFLLGEWRHAERRAIQRMRGGIAVLIVAVVLCAVSSTL